MISPLLKPAKRGPKPRKPIARKSRPAPVRKTARGRAKESLDRLFSRVIRLRDPWCLIRLCNPGTSFALVPKASTDAAHLFPKSAYPSIRWHLLNAVGACRPCHRYMTERSAKWHDWILGFLSMEKRGLLIRLSGQPSPDMAETRATLTAELKSLTQ